MRPALIDEKTRKCHASGDRCTGTFTMRDYPPGYFAYKYQLKAGSIVNTCPQCEIDTLERFVEVARAKDPLTISPGMQRTALRTLENIELLRTGRIDTRRHRKQALHTHGIRG